MGVRRTMTALIAAAAVVLSAFACFGCGTAPAVPSSTSGVTQTNQAPGSITLRPVLSAGQTMDPDVLKSCVDILKARMDLLGIRDYRVAVADAARRALQQQPLGAHEPTGS